MGSHLKGEGLQIKMEIQKRAQQMQSKQTIA
jgi:hypothetical protein